MRTSYFAAVYWTSQSESAEECARRMELLLQLLAQCHPDYTRWFQTADSLEEALQLEFTPDHTTLLRILDTEEHNHGPMGFSFSCWTGQVDEDRGGGLRIFCGGDIPDAPPLNNCQLKLPQQETEFGNQVLTRTFLTKLMRALVVAWDPDWGVIVSDAVRDQLEPPRLAGTYMGWLTYITRRWGEVPALPGVLSVEPIEDKGSLVVLTEDPLGTNSEHLELNRRVQQHLFAQGLLREI